jgi:hypothetical protein
MSFLDRYSGIYGPFGNESPLITNPLSVGGQAQNLTGPIVPLGGFNAATTAITNAVKNMVPPNTPAQTGVASGSTARPAGGNASPIAPAGSIDFGNYFVRGIVMIVGAIFLFVGLNMLKPGMIAIPSMPK